MYKDWVNKLFVDRSDLFLRLLNQKWLKTEELVNGMTKVLDGFGINSGNLLDLCCGNGRVSIHMAKKGFKTVGVDISRAFLEDANRKAKEHGVSNLVTFLEGDVRNLNKVIGGSFRSFDVIVNAWTSVGFYKQEDDLSIFKQARELSSEKAILFVAETMHTEYLSIKFTPTSYTELDHIVLLENRKYDPITSQISTSWIFYNKRGQDLEFVDKVDITHHIYSLGELSSLLRRAGWETVAAYGDLSTLQPMSPLTSMNIVAKAI
ncbi:MAG: class I SAM-dependent methyltransferase [Candidatus Bathyarchaeia archaeon]|jgi:SAM-dependent methyltransferase